MNKIQINVNKNHKNMGMDLKVIIQVMDMFELKKIGPLVQKLKIAQ